jgi:beta-galactosidase
MPPRNPKTPAKGRERIRLDDGWRFHLGDVPGFPFGVPLHEWRFLPVGTEAPKDEKPAQPSFPTADWKPIVPWQDAFDQKPGYAWFRTVLPDVPGTRRILHFTTVKDHATVYLNGRKVFSHHDLWTDAFDVPLDAAWREGGPNHLAVLVQNHGWTGYVGHANLVLPYEPHVTAGPAAEGFSDRTWREVHLPHDYVVEGTFDERTQDPAHGYLPKTIGWYRREFDLPASDRGRRLWVDFDGIFRDSRVWFNGHLLGRHKSGYTPSRYDLTDRANYGGRNVLAVRVDARGHEGWWYEGGGIYRHVWLNKAAPAHVEPWGVQVLASPGSRPGAPAALEVRTGLVNHGPKGVSLRLVSEVLDPKDRVVAKLASPASLPKGAKRALTQKGRIPRPLLWSLETPHLYRLRSSLLAGGKVVDRVETPFGVRSFRFDPLRGFFLNGQPVKLKGTCNHQDHAGVGVAIPDRLFEFRVERLKAFGCNAYRCSHNPPAAELLDACDRMGMLVIDENRRLKDDPDTLAQLACMVKRDRNHPSIIAWSICNEEGKQGTPEGKKIAAKMKKVILPLDETRPITAAMNGGWGQGISDVIDLQGFNYNFVQYEPFRKKFPEKPCYGSETASTVSTRGVYVTDRDKGTVSAYDVNHAEWSHPAEAAWRPIADRPWMAGAFLWTGFDYKGEPTPYGWPCINSHFGVLDICGFPKDNAWYYKSWWGREPVLHLFPHWNWPGREGTQVDVWVHTNYDQVELSLNGKLIGWRETPKNGHLEWKVWYEPGVLKARAFKKGVFAAETTVETADAPAAVRLDPWVTRLIADNEDLTPVTVEIVDARGRRAPKADNEVLFRVSGPGRIAGVGNGDPSSHEPDKANRRRAFNGLCQVLVQATGEPGEITLTAGAEGLRVATLSLRSLKP